MLGVQELILSAPSPPGAPALPLAGPGRALAAAGAPARGQAPPPCPLILTMAGFVPTETGGRESKEGKIVP